MITQGLAADVNRLLSESPVDAVDGFHPTPATLTFVRTRSEKSTLLLVRGDEIEHQDPGFMIGVVGSMDPRKSLERSADQKCSVLTRAFQREGK